MVSEVSPRARAFGGGMLAEWRRASAARRLVLAGLLGVLAWSTLQGARVAYRVAWYGIADPMPREAPVIWSADTGHARRLDALAHRLAACLPAGSSLAVDPAAVDLDPQSTFFWSLWLAHFMPRHDVRPARPGSDFRAGADALLTRRDAGPALCVTGRFAVVELGDR